MKIKSNVIVTLLVAIFLSAIIPVVYYYKDKQVAEIPEFVSYNMMIDSLTIQLQQKAKENNCEGYILSITEIENNDPRLSTLRSDLNLVIASYNDWKLKANNEIRQEMKIRFQDNISKWKSMFSGNDLERMLQQKQKALPKYSAKAKLSKLNNAEIIEDRCIFIHVYSEKTESKVINISENFIHPATREKLKTEKGAEKSRLTKLKRAADFSLKMLLGFVFILFVYILISFICLFVQRMRVKKLKEYLLQEIEKREELFNNGHFVAVLDLADRYLSLFPNDTEIKAFRERLLDFTNDDPKKAQQAFVKAKKLQLLLNNYDQNSEQILLAQDEKNEISGLIPYNPELKSSYTKLIAYEERDNKRKNFSGKYNEVQKLFNEKYLKEAEQKVIDLQMEYPDFNEIISLKEGIENEQKIVGGKFKEIIRYFQQGEIETALHRLEEILILYKDMPEALKLKNKLEQNKKNDHILLVPERTGERTIEIFCTNEVVLGRKDIDVNPDIEFEDRRISRPHLRISIVDDKLIAEDLNSSAGSFINGDKILSKSLNNNDLLNLSKTIDFRVFIQKQNGIVTGFILAGNKKDYIILTSKLEFGFDSKNITGGKEDFSIVSEDKIKFLLTESDGILLEKGLKISLGNKKYTLEV